MEHLQLSSTKSMCDKYEYYWWGNYSVCSKNGAIETFIVDYLKKYNCSFIIDNTDCLTVQNYNKMWSRLTRTDKIIGALCTRDHVNVLLLPLDDDTFNNGLKSVLTKQLPWDQRTPIAFWRGISSSPLRKDVTVILKDCSYADVKLVKSVHSVPNDIIGEYCNLEIFMSHKYIFIIDGNYIASNHQWVFGSGSVPIMITHPDNQYWFKQYLIPMVNYVPVQYDLSDLKEKIEWLIQHDDLAKGISEAAMKLSDIFTSEFQKKYVVEQIHLICPSLTEYKKDVTVHDYRNEQENLASNINKNTLESLYEIVKHYRVHGPFNIAHMFYKEALTKCELYTDMYYNLMYEFYIFASYIGLTKVPFELVQCLNSGKHSQNVYSNMKFYKDVLVPLNVIDLSSNFTNPSDTFNSSSMSIVPHELGYVANIRFVNYTIDSGYKTKFGKIMTLNKYVKLDNYFNVIEEKIFSTPLFDTWVEGIEDIRIFNKDELLFIGSIANEDHNLSICIGKYDSTKDILEYTRIKQRHVIEKNWVLLLLQNELHVVYKWNPLTLCTIKDNELCTVRETKLPGIFEHARGSTCGFTYCNEIWFIVHLVSYEFPRHYYNVFAVFDLHMNLKKYSPPFKFEDDSIEYCIGLIVEPTRIIATYSVHDIKTKLATYDKSYIESRFI
jgi:hypothetical protein